MREIKFRVWDDKFKKMITIDVDDIRMNIANGDMHGCFSGGSVKEWIPLQFTGLTDKEGVDIYEGDILKSDKLRLNKVVTYVDDQAKFVASGLNPYQEKVQLHKFEFEIIGNVYQNPELLNA